jgi:hypothetical protein
VQRERLLAEHLFFEILRAASSTPWQMAATGFSQNICFRAAAQAMTCAGCSECGVASRIAPIVPSASTASRSRLSSRWCCVQKPRAASMAGSTARTIFSRSWPSDAVTRLRPQRPRPTTAARII